jgi:hypothetical protein
VQGLVARHTWAGVGRGPRRRGSVGLGGVAACRGGAAWGSAAARVCGGAGPRRRCCEGARAPLARGAAAWRVGAGSGVGRRAAAWRGEGGRGAAARRGDGGLKRGIETRD